MRQVSKRFSEIVVILLLIGVTSSVLFTVTAYSVATQTVVPDQIVHRDLAEEIHTTGVLPTPHFAYQMLVIAVRLISQDSGWLLSALLANLVAQAFVVTLLYLGLRFSVNLVVKEAHRLWLVRLVCAALAFGLVIATPALPLLDLFNVSTPPLLLGTITPTVYHNPTLLVLRVTALALFLFVGAYLLNSTVPARQPSPILLIVLGAVATVLCGISKPNYLLALLPALVLWTVWCWWRKRPFQWKIALFGVIVPGTLFLAWQYYFAYINPSALLEGSGIIFAPFEVVLTISGGSRGIMILRFAVSIVFPVIVYLCWWREARRDDVLNFAWLAFIIGAAYMYLFAESETRLTHGNFFWSAYITLFLLFFVSAQFVVRKMFDSDRRGLRLDWRTLLCIGAFLLHIYSGMRYIDFFEQWLVDSHETPLIVDETPGV